MRDRIKLAENKWSDHFASRIHKMTRSPKDIWQAVNTWEYWLKGYYKSPNIIRCKKDDGSFTQIDTENVEALSNRFHQICNAQVDIDWGAIKELLQRTSQIQIHNPLTFEEFNLSI